MASASLDAEVPKHLPLRELFIIKQDTWTHEQATLANCTDLKLVIAVCSQWDSEDKLIKENYLPWDNQSPHRFTDNCIYIMRVDELNTSTVFLKEIPVTCNCSSFPFQSCTTFISFETGNEICEIQSPNWWRLQWLPQQTAGQKDDGRLCLDGGKRMRKVTLDIVAHCSTFRLFVVNIVLSWPN